MRADIFARLVVAAVSMTAVLWLLTGSLDKMNESVSRPVPCAYEDSAGPCHWDAARQGNGKGKSFTVPPAGYERFRNVDGHKGCYIKVGETSYIWCKDGFTTES